MTRLAPTFTFKSHALVVDSLSVSEPTPAGVALQGFIDFIHYDQHPTFVQKLRQAPERSLTFVQNTCTSFGLLVSGLVDALLMSTKTTEQHSVPDAWHDPITQAQERLTRRARIQFAKRSGCPNTATYFTVLHALTTQIDFLSLHKDITEEGGSTVSPELTEQIRMHYLGLIASPHHQTELILTAFHTLHATNLNFGFRPTASSRTLLELTDALLATPSPFAPFANGGTWVAPFEARKEPLRALAEALKIRAHIDEAQHPLSELSQVDSFSNRSAPRL